MNLHETAMGQRFFNVQLPALINTLKDIAAALSRPAPSAISFPADSRYLLLITAAETLRSAHSPIWALSQVRFCSQDSRFISAPESR